MSVDEGEEVERGVWAEKDSEKELAGDVEEEEGGVLSELLERIEEFEEDGVRSRLSVTESRNARRGFVVPQTGGSGSL